MKNKGFTLIELLAVIVILAIIALIATPIVLNIINDAKEEANKRSVEMYAKAVENAIVQYQLKEKRKPTTFEEIEQYIKYDGNKIECDVDIYEDGNIYISNVSINRETVNMEYGKKQKYKNGEIVYFDVGKGAGCTKEEYEKSWDEKEKDYLNSKTEYYGVNGTSSQNSCLKFYAFNDDGGNTLNLLLDHNISGTYPRWSSSGSNINGPDKDRFLIQLKSRTDNWKGTLIPENYVYKSDNLTYTVPYKNEGYKARFIEANEIAKITGADKALNWDETKQSTEYYISSLTNTLSETCKRGNITGCKNGWLYDRTSGGCKEYGCLNDDNTTYAYGYWTISADSSSTWVWIVYSMGNISTSSPNNGYYGIRPVIEVLKSNLL